uniref:Uncharacterized protein n=1 Tax=viral metagenome TaxID=1070528 RepID=A0A6C0F3N2_9ZZZZ
MSETKWKKNIKFNEKKEDIAETTIVEGMEDKKINEIEAMEKKIRRINNKKKGFTKLPHLESVYDADPIPNTVNSEKELEEKEPEEKEPENLTVESENFDDDPVEPFVEGARGKPPPKKDTFEKVVDTLIYISILPYHISFLIADGLYKVARVKSPMSKDDKDYKNLAGTVQRFLTGLIGIFITYNVYFLYSSREVPSFIDAIMKQFKPKPAEAPPDMVSTVTDGVLPLKVALTPVRIFMFIFGQTLPLIKLIPFKALLFVLSGIVTYYFLTKGASEYFVKTFGNSFKLFIDPTSYKLNVTATIILAISMVYEISMIIVKYKTAAFADPRLILFWILFFGIAMGLGFIAEFVIPMFVFYVTMLCMMDNKDSPFNFPKVMSDINKSFVGDSDDIYECPVAGTDLEKFIIRCNKILGKVILENIHIWVLVPIILYNIYNTESGKSRIQSNYLRRAHNSIGGVTIFMLIITNKYLGERFKALFEKKNTFFDD